MYYGLVVLAVSMFGLQFFANQRYQKDMGSGFFQANFFTLLGCLLGVPVLLVINRFQFEYTGFTLLMSCAAYLNGLLFSVCALKAFEKVNLSVFSLLSMLGGMLLPLFVGILFFQEKLTWGISLCVSFIAVALALTVKKKDKEEKENEKSNAWVYYIGVFVFNGMSGVISKIYTAVPYAKASSAGYSVLTALITALFSAVFVVLLWKKRPKMTRNAVVCGTLAGPLSRVANYFLLIALTVLPASVNYPMVTGGTIIVSTLLAYFSSQKPNKKDWISVALAFIGIMFLTLLSI